MPSFKGHLQQDVQEFFCQLLSKLNTEKVPNGLNMPNGDAIDYGCRGRPISNIYRFLERIRIEHIVSKCSCDSKLDFGSICSLRNLPGNRDNRQNLMIPSKSSEEILNCVVNRMFTGAWQSEVTCIGCGNSNQNKEQFNTLPLEFPNKYHKQVSFFVFF